MDLWLGDVQGSTGKGQKRTKEVVCTFSFVCPKEKDTKKKMPGLSLQWYSGTGRRKIT